MVDEIAMGTIIPGSSAASTSGATDCCMSATRLADVVWVPIAVVLLVSLGAGNVHVGVSAVKLTMPLVIMIDYRK